MADAYDPHLDTAGGGRLVVLVPGMNGTGDLFYRQVPLLARSFRVATYALRDDAEDFEQLAADLADVIDSAEPDDRRAIVVGESFGGAVALTFALRHPERVDALVVLNSFAYYESQVRIRIALGALGLMPWPAMSLVRHLTAFRLHSRHTHRAEVRQFIARTAHARRQGYVNRLRLLRTYDVRERLHEIDRPALFLASECDHLVPAAEQARYMAARVPNSSIRILQGHGHICLIAPDLDLERILSEWLG